MKPINVPKKRIAVKLLRITLGGFGKKQPILSLINSGLKMTINLRSVLKK